MQGFRLMLEKVCLLLEFDISEDIVEFYLNYCRNLILSYCNILEIPDELDNTLIYLTAEIIKQSDNKKKTSIGDLSIELSDSFILKNYKSELNKFRKIGW